MSFTVPDLDEKQEATLIANGWTYVANSWGQSIWRHEDIGQRSASEALELIEAEDG